MPARACKIAPQSSLFGTAEVVLGSQIGIFQIAGQCQRWN
jgi:hypothetical protein